MCEESPRSPAQMASEGRPRGERPHPFGNGFRRVCGSPAMSAPKAVDGQNEDAVFQGEGRLPSVEDDSCQEALAQSVAQLAKPSGILGNDPARPLDLDTDRRAICPLHHEVDFVSVEGPPM